MCALTHKERYLFQEEIKKLTKPQCKEVLKQHYQTSRTELTLKELFCEYLDYGFNSDESMAMAQQVLKEGDHDKNGVINGEG